MAVNLEGIAHANLVVGIVFLAKQVDEVQTIEDAFVVAVNRVGIVRGSLFLMNRIEHDPKAIGILHLYLHELVELAVGIVPREPGLARREHLLRELRRPVLRRRGRHEVVLAIVAHARSDAGIVVAGCSQAAVLVELRRVALEVPIVVALDAVVVVEHGADAPQGFGVLALSHTAGKGSVAVPRSAPYPFGYPDRATRRACPVANCVEVAFGPIAMQVDDVTAPATGIDAVDEALDVAGAVGVVAAVPRRG